LSTLAKRTSKWIVPDPFDQPNPLIGDLSEAIEPKLGAPSNIVSC
jgi:hypothetical protein